MPDSLNILEDEEVQLPFISNKEFSPNTVWLVRFNSSFKVIENCFDKISFNHEKGYQYGNITISGLERGKYTLYILPTDERISITVHKGVYWESDSFILKDHSLVEKREKTSIIRIKDILIEEEKEEGHTLSFNLEGHSKNARAHVFAHTFLQENMNSIFNQVESVGRDWTLLDIFPFAKWENIYLSNRKLGDEFRYVFDRKFVKRFMGNTLDRPQLLLNRFKLRETQFDQEVVATGNQYEEVKEKSSNYAIITQSIAGPANYLARNVAPKMMQQTAPQIMKQNIAPMAYSSSNINLNYEGAYGGNYGCPSMFKSFQNFLNNSACVLSNLVPDEKGAIKCSFDASKYSSAIILVIDEKSMVSQSIVDVEAALEKFEKRDLSLSNPLNPTKYYNEMRNSEILKKGDSHDIEDITSTDYIMVDSIDRVIQAHKEIRRAIGHSATEDLAFLAKWSNLSVEEKNKKYSQFVCHEVNLFLYFKDPDYFKTVVRPFISNKMEKSFIDLWLVGDHDAVVKYKQLELHDRLNTLEKCLLISEVVKDSKEDAQAIADRIKLLSDQKELKIDVINRIIDIVINLNMTQDQPKLIDSEARFCDTRQDDYIALDRVPMQPEMMMARARRAPMMAMNAAPKRDMKKMSKGRVKQNECIQRDECDDEEIYEENDYQDLRASTRTQFQEAEAATEYCEAHYYKNSSVFNPSTVQENPFWVDFANHIIKTGSPDGFVSSNFIFATNGDTQAYSVLGLMDLPYESPRQIMKSLGGKGIKITASENLVLYKKEIKEAEAELDTNLLVIHRFFEANNKNSEKKIKEFLVNQVYGCETIITNVSTKAQDFQILWQIPEGSLPLQNTNYQKSENKKLGSYSTTTFQYYFYFPHPGSFIQFPSNITVGEKVVAVANECRFEVVKERKEVSNETFRDILLSGNNKAIIEFLATANLYKGEKGFNFSDILWMLKDKVFFTEVTETLRSRKIYDDLVWKYGFYHKDPVTMRESLMRNNAILNQAGVFFESDLIKCSPETSNFRHLDYFPMINARAHKLGGDANPGILNRQFRDTYNRFLKVMAEKIKLDEIDLLNFTYYLLLQDRINEAIDVFEKIDPKYFDEKETLRMQYDYMRAYLDFFTGSETGFKIAKLISKKYADYPILAWKVLFTEILDQLEEFEEGVDYDEDIDQDDETKRKANLKKSINLEPTLH